MNEQQKTDEVRELTVDELDEASGGFLWIAAFVGGAAVGYGIRRGGEAISRWFAN